MPHRLPLHLQHLVDDVCGLGCKRVNEIIREVEDGCHDGELAHLETDELDAVLDVLKRVMAVYTRCSN